MAGSLLYVAPLCALDEKRLMGETNEEIVIDDPKTLANEDNRRLLWSNYAAFDDRYGDEEPEPLKDKGFEDLTIEPLLLYLLMYSGLAGKDWPEAKENRNRIYQAIFTKVHQRDKEEKRHIAMKGVGDFFTLMECMGLAAGQNGGRTGSDEDFAKIRDEIYAPEKQKAFQGLDSAQLKNVAVQFYTHQGGREDGYAFIHKSFGEYLAARAFIKASEAWCDHHGKRNRWDSFAEDWLKLTGGQRLSPEILKFMIDEARLQIKPCSRHDPDTQRARKVVEQLCEVATQTLGHGFSAHMVLPVSKGDASWRQREIYQRDAEMTLYSVIHAWAESAYPFVINDDGSIERNWDPGRIKVTWPNKSVRPAEAILRRLYDQWGNGGLATRIFARWDWSSQSFGYIDLHKFKLIGANLSRANLLEANLRHADLTGANLHSADLHKADLRFSNIRGADLSEANLCRVNFSELRTLMDLGLPGFEKGGVANLSQVNLRKANLERANLHKVNLREANLSEANLSEADLSDADLREAYLSGANCSRMDISSALLEHADLSEAINLKQEQIDVAYGNFSTRLPDGIDMPEAWLKED